MWVHFVDFTRFDAARANWRAVFGGSCALPVGTEVARFIGTKLTRFTMMKQLSFSVALLLAAAACKTDSPAPSSSGAAAEPAAAATTGTARSAKIDVKPVRPPPPSLTADDPGKAEEPADRPRRGGR